MHVTFFALGSRGDVQPYANLGQYLTTAGHQVRFITFENFKPLIEGCGLQFHPIRGDAQALVQKAGTNMLAAMRTFTSLAKQYCEDLSAPHLWETDLIINQPPLGLYGYDLAEKAGVPLVQASVIPLSPTADFPLIGAPRVPLPGYNRALYALVQQLTWWGYRPVINPWREKVLGLPRQSWRGYMSKLGTAQLPILNGFSEHIVPRPADWGEHIHITGYWLTAAQAWTPPAELVNFLEAGPPPVFIGFGSMPVAKPQETTAAIVSALQQTKQRAILHMGWAGLGQTTLPDHIYPIGDTPYSWLLPRMSFIIHHGGSGTTASGAMAGVPSMVVPFMFDQFYWGERLTELGVGPRPVPFKQLTAEKLAQAIQQVQQSPTMKQKAAELGQKLQAEQGLERAKQLLEAIQRKA